MLSVQNLRLKFAGESSFVFKDLSFAVPAGQKVLLLGPSGCGKSTLLQVLSGIIPNSLEVPLKYDSIDIPPSWGFVFQDPDTQFCMPYVDEELAFVLENLCVAREQMEPLMREVLHLVGLHFEDMHIPIDSLSLGMKQRLALAASLLLKPDVLFLDEPTALLDQEGTALIWNHVKSIAEQKTVIIVEHKIDLLLDWIDRVVLFNDRGEMMADGDPDVIFTEYKQQLLDYGIWYPGVWEDYLQGETYKKMMLMRRAERHEEQHVERQLALSVLSDSHQIEHLKLANFRGYRQEVARIHVAKAAAQKGEWIVVRGANGAGKSTLLLSLMQLLQTTGDYLINGQPVKHRTARKWLKRGARDSLLNHLAFVFQNPELQFIMNSLYDEVALSLRLANWEEADVEQKVSEQLRAFHLTMDSERHPYQLSSGQKRRLSVAAAIIKAQPIILLDEPTFGQDAHNTFVIIESLERLRQQGTTIIMVTHDERITRHFATKIWHIQAGKLSETMHEPHEPHTTKTEGKRERSIQTS